MNKRQTALKTQARSEAVNLWQPELHTKELSVGYAERNKVNLTPVYHVGFCLVSARGAEGSEETY